MGSEETANQQKTEDRTAQRTRTVPLWISVILLILIALILPGIALILFFTAPALDFKASEIDIRATVASQMYQIFFLLVVLGGSVGAVAYWLMKHDLFETARNAVDNRMNEKIDEADKRMKQRIEEAEELVEERILRSSLFAEAKAYQGLSNAIFRNYQKHYRQLLSNYRGKAKPTTGSSFAEDRLKSSILRDISLAKEITRLGIKLFDNERLKRYRDVYIDKRSAVNSPFYRYHALLSHFVYHCAVEQVVIHDGEFKGDPKEYEDFQVAIEYADICLRRALDPPLLENWYDFLENSGFCLALSPIRTEEERGKNTVKDLITGDACPKDAPPAPLEWRQNAWEEYNDALSLGLPKP